MKKRKWFALLIGVVLTIASVFFTAYLKQRRRDRYQNLIAEVVYKEKEVKWVKNSFYGLIFESPNSGLNPKDEITNNDLPGAKTSKLNYLATGDLLYYVFYADLSTEHYDFEKGMEESLSNLVKDLEGSDLKFDFKYGESWLPFALADGEFKRNSEQIILKAFLSFNKTINKGNKLRGLVILGSKTDQNQEILTKSISSVDLLFLKKEKNPLMVYAEDGGTKFKNYDPNDTVKNPEQIESLKKLSILRQRILDRKMGKEALGGEIGFNPEPLKEKKMEVGSTTEYYNQGITKSELKDHDGAIIAFSKVIELDPNDVDAYYNRGYSKAELKDYRGAIADFNTVIRLDSNYIGAFYNRGLSKGQIGDYTGSIADFTKAIEFDPTDGGAFFNRGISRLKSGQKQNGCLDLTLAEKLGYFDENGVRKNYCN